jgi:hypothetical protein
MRGELTDIARERVVLAVCISIWAKTKKSPYIYGLLILLWSLAWGGNWGGYLGIDESALPLTYEIDYVRVFQK